jgi:hypothetical protein
VSGVRGHKTPRKSVSTNESHKETRVHRRGK